MNVRGEMCQIKILIFLLLRVQRGGAAAERLWNNVPVAPVTPPEL